MGCLNFFGDVLGFNFVKKGLKTNPKLTWVGLLSFWAWAFVTGMMIVRYAHLGEHPYVFEIMPIASCLSPVVAMVGVLFFTVGDALTNVFSEAFQSSFGFMPFDLYAAVGAPHPLLTWGAYVRLNLVGLMSYALLPGLMGRLFSRLMKGLIGSILPKRRAPAAVYADGPRERAPRQPGEPPLPREWQPGQLERVPQEPGEPPLPREWQPGDLETGPRESMPIDPPPGMKPGDIMVNMGPDSPGQIIRDGVVIQGEGLGTRVEIPGLTPPAAGSVTAQQQILIDQGPDMGGGIDAAPQQGEILINQGPDMGGAPTDPSFYDAPGTRPGDILVNMGPDSPGQVIRDGVVISGEGVGSRVGMPGDGEILINQGPDMGEPLDIGPGRTPIDEPLDIGPPPGARDGDILVNMGPDSQGQVIRDGRVIAGEGAVDWDSSSGMAGQTSRTSLPDIMGVDNIGVRSGRGPRNVGDMPLNSGADLAGGPRGPRNVGDMPLNSGADLAGEVGPMSAEGVRSGVGTMPNAGMGNALGTTGFGSHEGIGYAPGASMGAAGVAGGSFTPSGFGATMPGTGLGGTMPSSGLGGVLGQVAGISPTYTGPGSGFVTGPAQVALEAGVRSGQIASIAGLGQAAALGQQGIADAIGSRRRRPRGPKPGWGHEPYRLPPQQQIAPPLPPEFYPEPGGYDGGVNWSDLIPGYVGAVVGATGGIAVGGGIYYGDMWAEYHPIRQITHPSGSPDPSCFKMDADYAVQNVVTGGTMAPVGGAAVVAGGGTPPPPPSGGTGSTGTGSTGSGATGPSGPSGPQPPGDQTIEWTSSDGRTHVLEKQPDGNYINILTGGQVDGTDINGWKQTYEDNLGRTNDWRQRNEYLEKTGQDSMSQALAKIKADGEARQHIIDRVNHMERNVFDGKYGLDEFLGRDGGPGDMMANLRDIANQATGRGPIDMNKFDAITKLYTNTISGRSMPESQMPTPDGFMDNVVNGGIETVKQLSTVRGPDGKFSKLSLAGRIGADILTLGYAETVFIPAESLNVAKEYVDAGGDSALVGGLMAAGTAAVNLAGGELISRGIKAAPAIAKVGGELGDELVEGVVNSARSGNSTAQTVVNTATRAGQFVKGAYDAYGRPIVNGVKDVIDEVNVDLGRAPWEKPPGPGRVARPDVTNADANCRNADFINDPSVNIGRELDGIPPQTRSGIQQVADEHGVIIDMRPGDPKVVQRINEGCHPKGPDIHNKTINADDIRLGADPNSERLVGHFKPKLPDDVNHLLDRYVARDPTLTRQEIDGLTRVVDRYQQRWSEFVGNHGSISRNGKFEIRNGVIHNSRTGRAYTGDNDPMSVRDAVTGRLASAEKTNAVMNDLVGRNVGVEHNAHMNWNYRGQPAHPTGPQVDISGASSNRGAIQGQWRQNVTQQNAGIDQRIIGSHQIGRRNATPLVSFRPGAKPTGTVIRGGFLR